MRHILGITLTCTILTVPAAAQPITIDHEGAGCVIADEFPHLSARLEPAGDVVRARVRFRPEGGRYWYSVAMKPEAGAFSCVLPRPKKTMSSFTYYVEGTARDMTDVRTAEFSPMVESGPGACKGRVVAGTLGSAVVSLEAPAGAPAIPAGFSAAGVQATAGTAAAAEGDGLSKTAIYAIAGGGAALAGLVLAAGGGDSSSPGATTPSPPGTSTPPASTPPPPRRPGRRRLAPRRRRP
jgi:hypothetical protein